MAIDNNIDISSDIVKTTDDNAKDLANLEFLSELDKADSDNKDFDLLNSTIAEENKNNALDKDLAALLNSYDLSNDKVPTYDEEDRTAFLLPAIPAAIAGLSAGDVAVGGALAVGSTALLNNAPDSAEIKAETTQILGSIWDFLFGKKPTEINLGDNSSYDIGNKIGKKLGKAGTFGRIEAGKNVNLEDLKKGVEDGKSQANEEKNSNEFSAIGVETNWLNSVSNDLMLANNSAYAFENSIFGINTGDFSKTLPAFPSVFDDNYISGFDVDNLTNNYITQSPSIFNDSSAFINDPLAGSFDGFSDSYFSTIANGFLGNEDFGASQIYLSKEEYNQAYNLGFTEGKNGSMKHGDFFSQGKDMFIDGLFDGVKDGALAAENNGALAAENNGALAAENNVEETKMPEKDSTEKRNIIFKYSGPKAGKR